jgi:hypothetical protein
MLNILKRVVELERRLTKSHQRAIAILRRKVRCLSPQLAVIAAPAAILFSDIRMVAQRNGQFTELWIEYCVFVHRGQELGNARGVELLVEGDVGDSSEDSLDEEIVLRLEVSQKGLRRYVLVAGA